MKVGVAAFNQEKALVGAFSVITNLRMELFEALVTFRPRLATTQTQAKQNKICWIHLEQTAQKSFLNFCCIGYFGRYETNQAFMPGFGVL